MMLGIENLVSSPRWKQKLTGRRVALLAHPASVDRRLNHSIDVLAADGISLVAAFGPQHGLHGEKQDNMIESDDFIDPKYNIPVFSLYGKVRRPTEKMLSTFDVILIDLQDVGCRIYTFLTTLFYIMEDAARNGKEVWVLDRPNPVGRTVEGSKLNMDFASFVGAAPVPMRHGMTLAEAAQWYQKHKNLNLDVHFIPMMNYEPNAGPGFGWPRDEMAWINPSPNMPRLNAARAYGGTVLIEGTMISEGRGTTVPLEVVGSPWMDGEKVLREMAKNYPSWLAGCRLRSCFFEPTFHKFKGELCSGFQIHAEGSFYNTETFKPYRLIAAFLKSVRKLYPDQDIWRKPPYEYEEKLLPFDILSGDSRLREWVDDSSAAPSDLESFLDKDEKEFIQERAEFLIYS